MKAQIIDCKFKAWKSLEGIRLKKQYIVTKYLDSGSYADIFECFHIQNPSEKLVVKFSENIAVLAQELRVIKSLQEYRCKNIVKLIDFTTIVLRNFSESQPKDDCVVWACYIMPKYQQFRKTDPKELLSIGSKLLDALQIVHSTGRTYNDLKQDNIMIDEQGQPVLIDFGLCKKFRSQNGSHISEEDQIESFRGEINFSSPHTLNLRKPSRRDDLYALAYFLIFKLNYDKMPNDLDQLMEKCKNKSECILTSREFKIKNTLQQLSENSQNTSKNFISFCLQIQEMKFEQKPDYRALRNYLQTFDKIETPDQKSEIKKI